VKVNLWGSVGMFDGEAPIQTPLSDEQLAAIPGKRGVFLLEGPEAAPILLSTAANIRARMRTRLTDPDGPSKRADLREIARRLRWTFTDSRFETDWRYLQLARRMYPDRYRDMVSFRPSWFVHVNPDDRTPCLTRCRDPLVEPGRYYGPFPEGRSATRFIDALCDIFDLCRFDQVLRQAPDGKACMYAQMGRCEAPCDGSMPLDAYRRLIADACDCIEGDRETIGGKLTADMRRLAAEQRFETAAICRGRLASLDGLDAPAYRYAAPAEGFQFVFVQRGAKTGQAKTFLIDRGDIRRSATLKYPLQARQLEGVLARLRKSAAAACQMNAHRRDGVALASRYLFTSDEMKGLIVRCNDALTAAGLAERIESVAEALRLRKPAKPAKAKTSDPSEDPPGTST